MSGQSADAPPRTSRKCAICGKPATEESYPFCSRRCADVDLNRWLSGRYVIAGEKAPGGPPEGDDG
jgi:endogenous inhibitor of DNA gyrase (YacG/DUF329 family)